MPPTLRKKITFRRFNDSVGGWEYREVPATAQSADEIISEVQEAGWKVQNNPFGDVDLEEIKKDMTIEEIMVDYGFDPNKDWQDQ